MASNNEPVHRKLGRSPGRKLGALASASTPPSDCSLIALCRSTIVAHLERYPPESLTLIGEDEWESIIRLRHSRTAPKEGSGGLDGTGRLVPALSDRFLAEVETSNPHLAESAVVDQLVWRDCVEYKYRIGGLTRPRALTYPWPVLVQRLCGAVDSVAAIMKKDPSERDERAASEAIDILVKSPMNVALLKATGVGKGVKKIIKRALDLSPQVQRLEQLLTTWKYLAASNGVEIKGQDDQSSTCTAQSMKDDENDLSIAETCNMWRDLFAALEQCEEKRRSSQGKRMREIRKNLASGRPKVVKVRPASAKHERILARPAEAWRGGRGPPSSNVKMQQLRKEATVVAARQQRTVAAPSPRKASGFGAAVAFASGSKKNSNEQKKRDGRSFALPGGKRMKIPVKPAQGAKRNLVAKMKSLRK